jgi:hypothetical protein
VDPEIPISDQKKWVIDSGDNFSHEKIAPGPSKSKLCRSFQQQGKIMFKIS